MRLTRTMAAAAALLLTTVPVLADGPGEMAFDESSFEVIEEAGSAIIVVERSRGEDGAVTVDYAATAITATAGVDFQPVSGTLSWGAGDGSDRTFTVPILDDAEAEGIESIQLTLSNPTGGAILRTGRGTSVLRILGSDGGTGGGTGGDDNGGDDNGGDDNGGDDNGGDDNGGGGGGNDDSRNLIKLDQRNFLTSEGAGVAVVSVERSREEANAVTVDYATASGSALAGADYQGVSGTLSWGPNDGGRKTFLVPIVNDSSQEPAEYFEIILSNPTGGAVIHQARGTGRVTIVDNDQGDAAPPGNPSRPGTFKFDERGYRVIEGGPTVAVIVVERSRGQSGTVSVEYSTADGTATAGDDYEAASGILTWGNGDGSVKTFEIPVFDDDIGEGNETVELLLSNPTGGADILPARGSSVLTILDNEGTTSACLEDDDTLCLAGGRFMAEAVWRTADGNTGVGRRIPSTGNAGLFWFFTADNAEVLVKVLNACSFADRYWVFFAATTNVDFTLTVTDTATGVVREYSNPLGLAAEPVQDTFSFDTCP